MKSAGNEKGSVRVFIPSRDASGTAAVRDPVHISHKEKTMFCSACGHALEAGQPVCPQCGRPVAPVVAPAMAPMPPVPNIDFQLQNYAGRVRALSIVWYVYGGLSLVFSVVGMLFANAWFHGGIGPWSHGPWGRGPFGPEFLGPALLHFAWAFLVVRSALALAAGWGLMERAPWGRVVAIVAAFFCILRFPLGTALGIWTLVTLLGYRNTTLYDHL